MNISEHITQMTNGTHKWTCLLEILGVVLLITFLGWAIYSCVGRPVPVGERGENEAAMPPQITKEELIKQMSERDPNAPVPTDADRERLFKEMSQQAPTAGKSGVPVESDAPVAPSPTPAERAKLLEIMGQQAL